VEIMVEIMGTDLFFTVNSKNPKKKPKAAPSAKS
jgi:hypothetical protein